MDKRLVAFIERALRSDRTLLPLNESWQRLHSEYNIGTTQGNKINIGEKDRQELIGLVRQLAGLDLSSGSTSDFADATRAMALEQVRDEKWAGRAVSFRRLALKALPGRAFKLNGEFLQLPARSYLDIAYESVESIGHDAILVVENYECFDRLDLMQLNLGDADPLVLYRGDPRTGDVQAVHEFLKESKLPVLAMADLDPSGLLIAQSLPFVAGLVAPELNVIETLLPLGNPKLYHRQRPQAEHSLRNSPHKLIRQIWELIENFQKGLVQERWLQGDVRLIIHPIAMGETY